VREGTEETLAAGIETDDIKTHHSATFVLNSWQLIEAYRDDERVWEWCSPKDLDHSSWGMAVDKGKEEHGAVKRRAKEINKNRGKPWELFKCIKLLLVGKLGKPFSVA
jgi:hypothetical protein